MTDIAPVDDVPEDAESESSEPLSIQVGDKLAEMEPLKQSFLDSTSGFLETWIWEETDSIVDEESKRAVRLGPRRLRRLRRKLKRVESRFPKRVKKRLGKKEYWAHQSPTPEALLNASGGSGFINPYRPVKDGLPRAFQDPFKAVLTKVGRVHGKYKLGRPRWRRSRGVAGVLDYRGTVEIAKDMIEALTAYAVAADELRALLKLLEEEKSEETRQNAESLWKVNS